MDGRYRLTRSLARGRIGEVWLARDLELGRDVVLKQMAVDGARLWAEARALAKFSHPHVVTLYHAVPGRAASWLVMEHVPGGSLEGRPELSPEVAARIGAQIADALAALHDEGIVHCDIKPGNVVVTGDGTAKLADFGAAYRVGGAETITPNSAISYTPDYAAPEVVRGQPEPKSDVFSLGAMLYALVAGRPPRRGGAARQDQDSVDAHIARREAARGVVVLDADLGPLAEVLAAMLRRDPRHRPGAEEARRRLAEIAAAPGPLPAPSPAPEDEPAPGRPRRRAIATVAVAAALATGLALWAWGGGPSPAPEAATPAPDGRKSWTGRDVLGDPRTADPCALLRPASFGRFGQTELDPDYGNFDRCDVLIQPRSDSVVDLRVDFNRDPPPEQAKAPRTTGIVTVVEQSHESHECNRTLALDGVTDTTILVEAKRSEDGEAPLCEIADAATADAVRILNQGPIARRDPAFPSGSLAHQDVCTLLDARALELIPGIDAADPDRGFGGWDCEWESTTSDLWLDVRFDRGPPPDAQEGTSTRLGGLPAYIRPEGEGEETCLVLIAARTYASVGGRTNAETVRVLVGGSRPMDRLCRMATGLADSASARLPGAAAGKGPARSG